MLWNNCYKIDKGATDPNNSSWASDCSTFRFNFNLIVENGLHVENSPKEIENVQRECGFYDNDGDCTETCPSSKYTDRVRKICVSSCD